MNFNQLNIMTKYLFSILFCMLALVGYAQKEATMYVDGSLKVKPGEQVKASFQLKNNFEVIGAAFKVYLPTGVSLVSDADDYLCTTNPDRVPKKYQIGEVLLSTGDGYSIEIGSDGTKPIIGTEGELFSLTFKVDETISLGDLKIGFKDVSFQYMSDVSTDYEHADFDVPLKVYATYDISAVSSNEVMGAATVTHSGLVENGTSVTATATPVAGYEFVNWTVGDDVKSTENPYTFTAAENVALVANFKVRKYDVTFDVDGAITTSTLDFASVIPTPKSPVKTGYTFTGWNPEFVEGATVPVDGITYTATWTINQYTITFDTDGGSDVAPITQDYATEVTAPANPTKTGYTFTGWDKEIPATIPAEDMTIKAQWTINQYTITFDTDGASEVAPITQDYATEVTAPANPTKTGYTFAGWDKEIPATIPAEDMTIKAQWTINQYTVAFVSDEETLKSEKLDYNSAITVPADPAKTGYTFKGWSPEFVEGATVPAENVTYTAVWSVNQYTITFDTDGGSEVAPITQNYATEVTAPANPTKTGYTFAGWDKEIPATIPAEDMTVKAQWTINQYTVKFVSDEETLKSETLDYGTVITAPEVPEKEEYYFTGWSPEFAEGTTVPAHDITYTAVWAPVQHSYTITFDTDGGSEIEPIIQDAGTEVTPPANPTKTGYTFAGWDKELPVTMPSEDMTLKAQWTINQYTVMFISDGKTITSQRLDYGTVITTPPLSNKKGYTFTGWSPAFFKGTTVPAHDVTYNALWSVNQYTITFDTDGGSEIAPITQNYESAVMAPVIPTKTGYTFAGWDREFPVIMPAENITLKAQWTLSQYTITFDTDGGSEVAPITQDYTSAVTVPADPTKTGYTFAGWDKEIPTTMPAEDMTVKAQWTVNQYTVKFVADGTVVSEATLDFGSAITVPEAPAKEGYTFKGWSPEVDETVPANDMEYVAEYTVNSYKLTYVLDGVEVKALDVEYGAEIEDFVPEVETGRIFDGWTDEIPETMPARDLTINGKTSVDTFIRAHFATSSEGIEVYTANGSRVTPLNKADDINRLSRGTYIINGRKVVIRK